MRVVQVDVRCGFCPIEVEGSINGFPFYLRLRGGVGFAVAASPDGDPVAVACGEVSGFYINCTQRPEIAEHIEGYPGWADDEEVTLCLDKCVDAYLRVQGDGGGG